MKQFKIVMGAVAFSLLVCSCGSKKVVETAAFHDYETECLGMDMDGMQTLRVWAKGLDHSAALEEARKKAVYEVTFKGISGGECNAYPVVDEANARTKYEKYFDEFFEKGGKYKKFVKLRGEQKSKAKSYYGDGMEMVEVVVIVDRPALKKRFQKDKIIEKPKK